MGLAEFNKHVKEAEENAEIDDYAIVHALLAIAHAIIVHANRVTAERYE